MPLSTVLRNTQLQLEPVAGPATALDADRPTPTSRLIPDFLRRSVPQGYCPRIPNGWRVVTCPRQQFGILADTPCSPSAAPE